MSVVRRWFVLALAVVLAGPARATWSIVLYNRVTGECGVAVTSCVPGSSVGFWVPVIVVGEGAGAAQSFVDTTGGTRVRIRDGFRNGEAPADILAALAVLDPGHQTRQYGLVGRGGAPVAFTGNQNFAAALHRTGRIGDWDYAIQGNILTGDPVIVEAERALLASTGDCTQRIMAALEGGRIMGGDGRCSCSQGAPTSCGSPPASFTHTATSAWVAVARPGDTDGGCTGSGCATGTYFLLRQFHGGNASIDPVTELIERVRSWRTLQRGRADHFLSELATNATLLQADGGQSRATVHVRLVDIDGVPLTQGGAALFTTATGDPIGVAGIPTDFGDGTYAFDITSTAATGVAEFTVHVNHGSGRVVELWPPVRLESVAPRELHASVAAYSVADGTRVPFELRRPPVDAGRPYQLLGSASGTLPGATLPGGLAVPLNRDRLLEATFFASGAAPYTGFVGSLDAAARAHAALEFPPGTLAPLVGGTLWFAAVTDGAQVSNVVDVAVLP